MPGVEDGVGEAESIGREAAVRGGTVESLALGDESLGGRAVGVLEFRVRPQCRFESEARERLVGDGGVENGLDGIESMGDFVFVGTGDDEPERFALLVEVGLDGIERDGRRAVAWLEGIGGGVEFGKAEEENGYAR